MENRSSYQLLDFGCGRKLERFGRWIFDRPSPSAEGFSFSNKTHWQQADFYFDLQSKHQGRWLVASQTNLGNGHTIPSKNFHWFGEQFDQKREGNPWQILPDGFSFEIQSNHLTLQLKCTDFGHIGVFPEHFQHWNQISPLVKDQVQAAQPVNVLSLFAYTGASSLLMANSGAKVTNVEGAKNTTSWARQNAAKSGLADLPIRWIVDDVQKFVEREVRRGNQYQGIIVDPPTFGHGSKGQVWKIQQHLPLLLENLSKILAPDFLFLLLTAHSPGYDPNVLEDLAQDSLQNHYIKKHQQSVVKKLFSGSVGISTNGDPLTEVYSQQERDNATSSNRKTLPAGSVVCLTGSC